MQEMKGENKLTKRSSIFREATPVKEAQEGMQSWQLLPSSNLT